jgi:hypothetical protein
MRAKAIGAAAAMAALLWTALPASAQQRPLVTEDPETVGSGRMLFEFGYDFEHDARFPLSGLAGTLFAVPNAGVSIGVGPIAEIQIDGGFYQHFNVEQRVAAPFRSLLDFTGDSTTAMRDIVVGTKIRLLGEAPGRPGLGARFATRLPNVRVESGLGRGTTDFAAAFLIAKTIESVRFVGNVGLLMLPDPTRPVQRSQLMSYGFSVARAVAEGAEIVGELNARMSFAEEPPLDADDRGFFRVGARFTRGAVRVDGGFLLGLTPRDPDFGITAGVTWVINAFTIP